MRTQHTLSLSHPHSPTASSTTWSNPTATLRDSHHRADSHAAKNVRGTRWDCGSCPTAPYETWVSSILQAQAPRLRASKPQEGRARIRARVTMALGALRSTIRPFLPRRFVIPCNGLEPRTLWARFARCVAIQGVWTLPRSSLAFGFMRILMRAHVCGVKRQKMNV
jgi:hypothetical protein